MPVCFTCGENKPKSSYSRAQIRKKGKRKCFDCINNKEQNIDTQIEELKNELIDDFEQEDQVAADDNFNVEPAFNQEDVLQLQNGMKIELFISLCNITFTTFTTYNFREYQITK